MNEIFLFSTQFVISYLVLGCLLAGILSLALRFFSLNAAARHKVWLTALIVLVLAPILSLLTEAVIDKPQSTHLNDRAALAGTVMEQVPVGVAVAHVLGSVKLEPSSIAGGTSSRQVAILSTGPLYLERLSLALLKIPFTVELSISLCFLLAFGVGAKLFLYIRSLRALRVLIRSSEAVEGEWATVLGQCSRMMKMGRCIELRQSSEVSTPSTCGVLTPCIILPRAMLRDGYLADSRAQVLQHELAHIKRHDPLIAGLQAVVSVFLFWHPAVNYVNKKIRYEREIACDDWVVSNSEQDGNAGIKAYAYSIVSIAESLSRQTAIAHSVACINNPVGLQERIEILLDKQADHSTSVNLTPNVFVAAMALGFMFFSSTLLPRLPPSLFLKSTEIGVADPPALATTAYSISMGSEGSLLDNEPVAVTTEPYIQPLMDYAAPLPIPDISSGPVDKELSIVLSRAESIESTFDSKAPAIEFVNTAVIETINPILNRVTPVSLDELIGKQAGFSNMAFVTDKTDLQGKDSVAIESLSRRELAAEILRIELELYRVFNTVTDRDDLKMYCGTQTLLGSHISQTTCEPEFLRTARSEDTRYSIETFGRSRYRTSANVRKDMKAEYAELAAEILEGIKSNQYLLELYQVLAVLRGRLVEIA